MGVHVSIKFHLQNQAMSQIWPASHNLPTSEIWTRLQCPEQFSRCLTKVSLIAHQATMFASLPSHKIELHSLKQAVFYRVPKHLLTLLLRHMSLPNSYSS